MIVINGKYTDAIVFADSIEDTAYDQILELCNHFAFDNSVIRVMPDCHAGTGCVIGFTAVLYEKRIIPNIVGVDIGCGVMATIFKTEKNIDFKGLDNFIRQNIPSGMTIRERPSKYINSNPEIIKNIDNICKTINENDRKNLFINSLGTLGGGNHFIEIDRISDKTYMLAVHTGSRSVGLRVCRFFQSQGSVFDEKLKKQLLEKHKTVFTPEEHLAIQNEIHNIPKVSSELAYISEDMYDRYVECMISTMKYAYENRSCISKEIVRYITDNEDSEVTEMFDTVHNYVDWYDDSHTKIIIRKGAISANKGQRLSIPLNMHDGVVVGTGKGNNMWNNSAPHGSGRALSRSQARKTISLEDYVNYMNDVNTWSVSESTIDESPFAYKPSDKIIKYLKECVEIECIARTIYNFKAD